MTASTLFVYHISHGGGLALGFLAFCQYGPILAFSGWGGTLVDRSDKHRLLYVTQSLEMAQSLGLGAVAAFTGSSIYAIYALVFLGGCLLAIDNPARRSFVNEMVPQSDITNAVALYSSANALSRVIGPVAAGGLIAATGYAWCFAIDSASYILPLAALLLMQTGKLRRTPRGAGGRRQIRSGLQYAVSVPELRILFGMLLVVGTFSYNFTVTFPLLMEDGLKGTDGQYTYLYASFSAGGTIATIFLARFSKLGLRTNITAAAALGIAMLLLGAAPGALIAYPFGAMIGAASVAFMTSSMAIAQLVSRRDMLGRVLSLQTMLMLGTAPIGGPLLGLLANLGGGRVPMLAGGVAAACAALYGLAARRRWRVASGQQRVTD